MKKKRKKPARDLESEVFVVAVRAVGAWRHAGRGGFGFWGRSGYDVVVVDGIEARGNVVFIKTAMCSASMYRGESDAN